MPKCIKSHTNLSIRWRKDRNSFQLDLNPIGGKRENFDTKAEATAHAKEMFEIFQNGKPAVEVKPWTVEQAIVIHDGGLMITEMQGRVVWMCRARGSKDHGDYETVKGFEIQKLGHTITAVFDPNAITETGFVSCFAEPEEAVEFLTCKRGR